MRVHAAESASQRSAARCRQRAATCGPSPAFCSALAPAGPGTGCRANQPHAGLQCVAPGAPQAPRRSLPLTAHCLPLACRGASRQPWRPSATASTSTRSWSTCRPSMWAQGTPTSTASRCGGDWGAFVSPAAVGSGCCTAAPRRREPWPCRPSMWEHRCNPSLPALCSLLVFQWNVNIKRDTYASLIGHQTLAAYHAIAENESIGRVKYTFLQARPCCCCRCCRCCCCCRRCCCCCCCRCCCRCLCRCCCCRAAAAAAAVPLPSTVWCSCIAWCCARACS